MLWRPTHDLSSCTIFIFSRLTCVLKPLGLWKHIVNCNNVNYEKIRGENQLEPIDEFLLNRNGCSENEMDVLFVGKCRFQTATNQNKVFYTCLDFVLIIDFPARFDSKIKCCRAVFGFTKDKDEVKVSYFFVIFPGEEIICLNFHSFIQIFGVKNREKRPPSQTLKHILLLFFERKRKI